MNLAKILAELHGERKLIDEAIASLERLAAASGRPRRGRPPTWLQANKHRATRRRKRRAIPGAKVAGAVGDFGSPTGVKAK